MSTQFFNAFTLEGAMRVAIEGELLVSNRQEFKQRMLDLLEAGNRRFVLDLAQCAYIDGSGQGVLVSVSKKIRDAGGSLELRGLNEDLVNLFRITHLDSLFVIRDSAAVTV
ncbi:MAG TPA: STAS domain-containing protein [Gemmatimonadaceae bacterium]|nr:STAS domain-containing protein [Gemmatimonadaceae bacterium]